ncbi:hypothetical protein Phou_022770 [Phytohabitans houttuyneae]|uniref:DUF2332 domain-containing protein n=2 Tax=Phytohabitans houttuyneae TaxID=1076126 RepID=A0A6V8K8K8_9ACTN|nr:hypothetical protein Phou_022770 [Phytohabitans houttuyneae]
MLTRTFRHFARREFRGHSIRYEHLSAAVADHPQLATPLLAAPPGQRRAILFFAAVQYILRTVAPGHPLAGYLPTLGGTREADSAMPAALADLVAAHRDDLTALCATRTTQTNEARRAALLRPAFGRAAEMLGRPLTLVELGTSAGLLLISDRYTCEYRDGDRVESYGPAGGLTMSCEVRGGRWPSPAAADLVVADRVGIDLSPVDAADPRAVEWLRACVWPEHTERLTRLDAALAEVVAARPRLVAGEMVATLPGVLSTVDEDVVPCVFTSNALMYLSAADSRRLAATLAEVGARRDLAVVLNEASQCGAELFTGRPAEAGPRGMLAVGLLTLVVWRGGRATVEVLARTGPHGQWLEWVQREYGYEPAS